MILVRSGMADNANYSWMKDEVFLNEAATYLRDHELADKLMLGIRRREDGLFNNNGNNVLTVEYNNISKI
jgi:hypothetical protein